MRLNMDNCFMIIARMAAERSTCLRRQVGVVLVKDSITEKYEGLIDIRHNIL